MPVISPQETDRQYRVLRQTLSIHAMLRDEYACKSKILEIQLLVCSVIFCATTFASDELYSFFGLNPATSHIGLGVASVAALALSLVLMIMDYKGHAALHREAVVRWGAVLAEFRKNRSEDGTWPEEIREELNHAYWEADRNMVKIPEKRFNRLKSRYLRKVAVSELKSSYPGCPRFLLSVLFRYRDTKKFLRETGSTK